MQLLEKRNSECLKGIAACFIVLGHIIPDGLEKILVGIPIGGDLWVGLFFFYTGYGLSISVKNKPDYLTHFIKNKYRNIYLPFLVAETLYTISYSYLKKSLSIKDFIFGCIGIQLYNTTLWYVVEVLAIYIIFYVYYRYFMGETVRKLTTQ